MFPIAIYACTCSPVAGFSDPIVSFYGWLGSLPEELKEAADEPGLLDARCVLGFEAGPVLLLIDDIGCSKLHPGYAKQLGEILTQCNDN